MSACDTPPGKVLSLNHAMTLGPRRGLSRREAAHYIGVSPTTFDKLVKNGTMPKPVRMNARTIWDLRALDEAFDELTDEKFRNPWAA
jgi:predicted DNA-binding transcriptional regulator AlpA